MNDFEILCKRLENGKKYCFKQCYETNNYLCAKNAVLHYINQDDKNKLLQIKAEAQEGVFREYISILISLLSMFFAAVAFIISINAECDLAKKIVLEILFLMVVLLMIYVLWFTKKFACVNKWRGYVRVAIDEIEKELE